MKYYLLSILAFLFLISRAQDIVAVNDSVITIDTLTTVKVNEDTAISMGEDEIALLDFDSYMIEQHEGCTDSLVYPGGISGPTISCGFDLGNAGYKTVSEVLLNSVTPEEYAVLVKAVNVRGDASESWIRKNQIHLGDKTAKRICNNLKVYIWRLLTTKYPNLPEAPGEVKSAVLDIAFQCGVGSNRMNGFGEAISKKNWRLVGRLVSNSYIDFEGGKYSSIHRRRVDQGMQIEFLYNPPKNVQIDYD